MRGGCRLASGRRARLAALAIAALAQAGSQCGGGGGGGDGGGGNACDGSCAQQRLETADVELVIRQAVAEATVNGVASATIAVVDRVGNVLAVHQMPAATPADFTVPTTTIGSRRASLTNPTGLEGVPVPASVAAISKAGTAAYLSSQGNAFSTRTASQIVQEHFNPLERDRAGGPLFGVQFSQLPCGDLVGRFDADALRGPKRLPLGFSGDPGGLPLYKSGVPVGGVGVEFDGDYTVDLDVVDRDSDLEERVATAATFGFGAPADRRADAIAVDGRFLRFADDESPQATAGDLRPFDPTGLVAVPGFSAATVRQGSRFLDVESGVVAGTNNLLGPHELLVDSGGANRYPPRDSLNPPAAGAPVPGPGLTATEVTVVLREALAVAARARAQIRQPGGSAARVNISVVDLSGAVLGFVRSPDAPVFGIDVSLQKARTAAFLSGANAAADLQAALALPCFRDAFGTRPPGEYVADVRAFLGDANALTGTIAFADRSGGNLARPFFPDGIDGRANGPLSRPFSEWSPFSTGLQLDAGMIQVAVATCPIVPAVQQVAATCLAVPVGACPPVAPDPANPCVCDALQAALGPPPGSPGCGDPTSLAELANGLQIFPGSVPIYRGGTLIGGIGISGDGVDQDDLVAFLGLHNGGAAPELANPPNPFGAFGNAPSGIRADTLAVQATNLRYVSCPPSPFNDSNEQEPCGGK